MTNYEFRPIPADVVAELRKIDDAGVTRKPFVDEEGGSPLRCCLSRSRPGESIMLVSYAPLRRWARAVGAEPGAYDEIGPVFVHAATCAGPATYEFPVGYMTSPRVFRAYDANGHILDGQVVRVETAHGATAARSALDQLFADPSTAMVHIRAIAHGCFQTYVPHPGGQGESLDTP